MAKLMNTLQIPFGKRISDGLLVTADEVPRGAACDCICLDCGSALVAKQGTEREWHFAHARGADCTRAYEKSVHEYAKQLLRQRKRLILPSLTAIVSDTDAFGAYVVERDVVLPGTVVDLEECVSGRPLQDVTPDLIGTYRGRQILVEVTVFHRLMPEKRERLLATRIPVIEINLSIFQTQRATREKLEQELFKNDGNRHWVWHPKQEIVCQQLQTRLKERLAEARQRRDEERSQVPLIPERATWRPPSPQSMGGQVRKWRAGLPSRESILNAADSLANRTGCDKAAILELTDAITTRSQLANSEPSDLAARWGKALDLEEAAIETFLDEAEYTWRR